MYSINDQRWIGNTVQWEAPAEGYALPIMETRTLLLSRLWEKTKLENENECGPES